MAETLNFSIKIKGIEAKVTIPNPQEVFDRDPELGLTMLGVLAGNTYEHRPIPQPEAEPRS